MMDPLRILHPACVSPCIHSVQTCYIDLLTLVSSTPTFHSSSSNLSSSPPLIPSSVPHAVALGVSFAHSLAPMPPFSLESLQQSLPIQVPMASSAMKCSIDWLSFLPALSYLEVYFLRNSAHIPSIGTIFISGVRAFGVWFFGESGYGESTDEVLFFVVVCVLVGVTSGGLSRLSGLEVFVQ